MRTVCWFSCGAASAVATKFVLETIPDAEVVYCKVQEEHPDNERFLADCERWFGKKITVLTNEKYGGSIYEVFEKTRYLVGPGGARCTLELKKKLRKDFEQPDDAQVFGYTAEEVDRADSFIDANPGVNLVTPLIAADLGKSDCLALIAKAGIELPAMYGLGYSNNNCIGCVKGGTGYWNKIRVDFPEAFARMAKVERSLGRQICKVTIERKRQRVYLDELPPDAGHAVRDMPVSCSFACELVEFSTLKEES